MDRKSLFLLILISSASHLSYSSYIPLISGHLPVLEESQQDYQGYISTFKQWIEKGHSIKEGDQEQYKHQATFKKIEENLESSPTHSKSPYTKIEPRRFFMDQQEQKVDVAFYDIFLSHLIQASAEEQDTRGYHYSDGVLYRPLHQTISYRLPALEGVEGCEQEVSYTKHNYVLPTQEFEKAAFNFVVTPDQNTLPNGYYGSRLRQEKPHSYIYSSEKDLFVMHYQSEAMDLVNYADKAQFNFLFNTPHKLLLKPDYLTTDIAYGLLPKGIFMYQQSGQWQHVKEDLSIDPGKTYTLSHPEGLYFQTIDLEATASNAQVLQNLYLSSAAKLIENLDFKGRVFKQDEKQGLISLLKSVGQLKSLNLAKEEATIDYNDLVPALSALTNLKNLNLTNGQLTEENRQKLMALAGLELVPAPAPAQPADAPAPAANPEGQDQPNTAPQPVQPIPETLASASDTTAQSPQDPVRQPVNPEMPAPQEILPPVEEGAPTVEPIPRLTPAPTPDPEAPAAPPVLAPKEEEEPSVESTPIVTPTAPVVEPVTSTSEVSAVTLAAPATESSGAETANQ